MQKLKVQRLSLIHIFNLCLNGHVLALAAGASGSVIRLENNASLNLCDCTETTHAFRVGEDGVWVRDEENGSKQLTGGVITGGSGSLNNGFVFGRFDDSGDCYAGGIAVLENTALHMYGGNVVGNRTTGDLETYGGGIAAFRATVELAGGSVAGNASGSGGGLFLRDTAFTISGSAAVRDLSLIHISIHCGVPHIMMPRFLARPCSASLYIVSSFS